MCVHARIPLSRSASTFGKLVARLSSNFYSLSGTDDKKTAQTESSLFLISVHLLLPLPPSSQFPRPSPTNPIPLCSIDFFPLLFPFFHSTNGLLPRSWVTQGLFQLFLFSLVSTMLLSLTFYLLIDESRVNPLGLGPPLDKISLIRSRPSKVFLLPLESLLLETLCFLEIF